VDRKHKYLLEIPSLFGNGSTGLKVITVKIYFRVIDTAVSLFNVSGNMINTRGKARDQGVFAGSLQNDEIFVLLITTVRKIEGAEIDDAAW
jgi:hypothetical protein